MEKKIKPCIDDEEMLNKRFLALRDTLELFGGKWRFCLLLNIYYHERLRFKDFFEVSTGISPKILSKELTILEEHQLVQKVVEYTPTQDITYYQLTSHAQMIWPVLNSLIEFGLLNRKEVIEAIVKDKS